MATLPMFPSHAPSTSYAHGTAGAAQGDDNAKAGPSRAIRRKLMGGPRAGSGLDEEHEQLSDDEEEAAVRKREEAAFGFRFLIPIGRRQTAMELSLDGKYTPSEPDHERRQEDRNADSESLGGERSVAEVEGEAVDLDASVEDMDAGDHASASEPTESGEISGSEAMEEDS